MVNRNDELSLDHPPRGIRMEQTVDGGTAITVRMFGLISFVMLCATVMCIVFAFAFAGGIIAMIVEKCGWTMPDWLLFHSGSNGNVVPALVLFLLLALGIWLVWLTIFYFFGKCVIRLSYNEGSVFTGIGSLGRTRHFSPKSVKLFMADPVYSTEHTENVVTSYLIAIKMDNGHKIGLPDLYDRTQERWLLFALRKILDRKVPADIMIYP